VRIVYIDGERVRPADVLRETDAWDVYVVPVLAPWREALAAALRDRGRTVRTDAEGLYVPAVGVTVPLRPPWTEVDWDDVRPLDEGGQGRVFRAGGRVVKVARADEARRLGLAEGVLGRARLPGLLPVEDVCSSEEFYVFLYPFCPGALEDAAPAEAARALAEVARTLGGLADLGWVHMDVKPANIRRGAEGRWWLLDTGSALRVGARPRRVAVTLRFAAPEVVRATLAGEPPEIRPAVDVYALAVTAVEVLTGRRLWESTGAVRMAAVTGTAPAWTPPPDWPAEAVAALRAALDPTPEARPTARDLGGALERLAEALEEADDGSAS